MYFCESKSAQERDFLTNCYRGTPSSHDHIALSTASEALLPALRRCQGVEKKKSYDQKHVIVPGIRLTNKKNGQGEQPISPPPTSATTYHTPFILACPIRAECVPYNSSRSSETRLSRQIFSYCSSHSHPIGYRPKKKTKTKNPAYTDRRTTFMRTACLRTKPTGRSRKAYHTRGTNTTTPPTTPSRRSTC